MVLLYTHTVSRRLEYIVGFFSRELFNEPIAITTDITVFSNADAYRINYSDSSYSDEEFFITSAPLLFESGISPQIIDCFEVNYHKAFFQCPGDFPFDIFAAAFYLLSRYEEYLPYEKDEHGRFSHISSLAYREDFLRHPLIDIWMNDFRRALLRKFPQIPLRHLQFKCIVSYDIDIAYAFLHKGWKINLAGFFNSVLKGKFSETLLRWKVLVGSMKDPYDCYEWLDALHLYCRLKPYYFFLVAGRQNKYDRNLPTNVKALSDLIQYYAMHYQVGIHPSWRSHESKEILQEEIQWLEVVSDRPVMLSRQHYVRIEFPETYRRLEAAGIKKDFSMGYGTINGFRASASMPFLWYDLEAERQTDLMIYPFSYMDANSYYEEKHTPEAAYKELMYYYEAVKHVNGTFISIWHNNILGTMPGMAEWRTMFELFMKDTVYWDAYYDEV